MGDYQQHGSRHLPGGSDPIPTLAITQSVGVMEFAMVDLANWTWTQPGDTFVDFSAATITISDTSVFSNNVRTDGTAPIIVLKNGFYYVWGSIGRWQFAWGTQARVTNLGPSVGWALENLSATSFPITYDNYGSLGTNLTIQGLLRLQGTEPLTSTLRMEVAQNSGADRNVSAALRILRLTSNATGTS